MQRIEVNLETGEQTIIDLSPEEQAEIIANQPPPYVPTNAELLAQTDNWMSRVTEDTVVALIQAEVVTKDQYAPIVIERINYRRSLRNQPPI